MWTITDPAPNAHALRLMVDRDVSLRIGCGRANGDDSNPGWQNAQTFKAHVEYRLPMRGRGATSCNRLEDVEALGSIWIQAGDSSKPVDARFLQLQVEFGDGRRESLVEPAADAAIGRNQTIVAQGAAWGCAQNRPVFLGEFGTFNSADDVMNPPAWLQSERAHWLRVTREAVEGLHGKKLVLFQTLGADPASDHAVTALVNAGVALNKDCKVLATLSIRGAIDPALIAMMRKMPAGSPHSPSPESEARWAAAASHPDAEDLAKAKDFMQGFLAMYDKYLKMM